MIILGIDPGVKTGVATFVDGDLRSIETLTHEAMIKRIADKTAGNAVDGVLYEDSTLQGFFNRPNLSRKVNNKIARSVGTVDSKCAAIQATCVALGIPVLQVSPLKKGAKLTAGQFKQRTGWQPRTSQHGRDAAMVAWGHRRATIEFAEDW